MWVDTNVFLSECDIPVPGIPGPGNFAPFWMVPVPVPEKFGPGKKYRYRYRKNLVPEKSTGPGNGKNSGYRHTLVGKVVNRVAHMVADMDFSIIFWAFLCFEFFSKMFCISR